MLGIATFSERAYIERMNHEKYRARRKELRLTQAQLAVRLGLGRDTIIAREQGKYRLTREHFLALDAIDALRRRLARN